MNYKLIITTFFVLSHIMTCHAQESTPIDIYKAHWYGTAYYQNGKRLYKDDLKRILSVDAMASSKYKQAQNVKTTARVMTAIGAGLIGYPIGEKIAGSRNPKWTLALIGGGLIAVGIPISAVANSQTKKSVILYNEKLLSDIDQAKTKYALSMIASANRIGIGVTF